MAEMKKDDLEKVNGGFFSSTDAQVSYQLYYKGEALPMTNTVAQMCEKFSTLKSALGIMYSMVANMTLNDVCAKFGQSTIQGLLDKN